MTSPIILFRIGSLLIPVLLLFLSRPLLGQNDLTMCEDPPFLLSPIDPICANKNELVTYSFTIANRGEPGNYEIIVPGRLNPVMLTGIEDVYNFKDTILFDCENMPGSPSYPSQGKPYYEYLINVRRTDCFGPNQEYYEIKPSLKVFPNPIKPFKYSETTCISPLCVEFISEVCDADLVKKYQWYVNGDTIPMGTNDTVIYCFPNQGDFHIKLEVTSFGNCPSFSYEEVIAITADPSPRLNLGIDSSRLCQDTITIPIVGTAVYVDEFSWSSFDPRITFSDPKASNPIVTIINTDADTYNFSLTARNEKCGEVRKDFAVETLSGQSIELLGEIEVCQGVPVDLCQYFAFDPPDVGSVIWSATAGNANFSDTSAPCPTVEFIVSGNLMVRVSGEDQCGNEFSFDIPVHIKEAPVLVIDFSPVEPLCEKDSAIYLPDYVSNPEQIVACRIKGVPSDDCLFDPAQYSGNIPIEFIDSCGTAHMDTLTVVSAKVFEAGDQTLCLGDTLSLVAIQAGYYSGPNVVNGIFNGLAINTYAITFSDTSSCGGTSVFNIDVVVPPQAGFFVENAHCQAGISVFPQGSLLDIISISNAKVISYHIPALGNLLIPDVDDTQLLFPQQGDFEIIQIVEAAKNCRDTLVKTITIAPPYVPQVNVVVDSSGCDSIYIAYQVLSPVEGYAYKWTFSNGESALTPKVTVGLERQLSDHFFSAVVAIETYCESLDPIAFRHDITARFQTSLAILNDNNRVCSGDMAFFQNTSSNYDSLSFLVESRHLEKLEYYIFTNASDEIVAQEVVLHGFKNGCPPMTARDTVWVLPVDTKASFSLDYTSLCSPATIVLENSSTPGGSDLVRWGDGSSPQQVNSLAKMTHTYEFAIDTIVTIMLSSKLCGEDTMRRDIQIYAAPQTEFDYYQPAGPCEGDSVIFIPFGDIAEVLDFDWDYGDSSLIDHFFSPAHIYEHAGVYPVQLTVTSPNGCSSIYTTPVTVHNYSGPSLLVEAPSTICANEPLGLEIVQSGPGLWIEYGNNLASSKPIPIPYQETGSYLLQVITSDQQGCQQDTTLLITVVSSITVDILPVENTINYGDEILLNFSMSPERTLQTIRWQGDSIQYPDRKISSALPAGDGFYILEVMDVFGCTATDSIDVQMDYRYDKRIFFPNSFSPNDDGWNDWFYIFAKANTVAEVKAFKVFDRGGNMLFHCRGDCMPPNTSRFGWDGTVLGRKMKPAVFAWFADIEFLNGHRMLFSGDVTLVR